MLPSRKMIPIICMWSVSVPLPKHQGGPGLSVIKGGRRAADDHGGPTVPSQGVLQDPGHLTVPVRDISLPEDTQYTQCKDI